ncbi:MAG: sucrose-phosphate phosphatase [Thermosynechococcaceae cyanobacterium]
MQWLLATDLDNTLVGDDAALDRLNERLRVARSSQNAYLVYATGRSRQSYGQLCTTTPLLEPDVLIAAVGTEIYQAGSEIPDAAWSAQLQDHWDRSLVQQVVTEQFTVLSPQTESEQRPFKASYFLDPAIADAVIADLTEALQTEGIQAQFIYSGGKDLDIVPQTANKGKALQFVRAQYGVDASQTVACGDSGNDIALFSEDNHRGILVGNAQPELLQWHHANPSGDRYLAQAAYAAGILEGLVFFGFVADQTLV